MTFLKWLFERLVKAIIGETLAEVRQAFTWWVAMRRARSLGAAQERARESQVAREAEQEMGDVATQNRSTVETGRRLNDGTF